MSICIINNIEGYIEANSDFMHQLAMVYERLMDPSMPKININLNVISLNGPSVNTMQSFNVPMIENMLRPYIEGFDSKKFMSNVTIFPYAMKYEDFAAKASRNDKPLTLLQIVMAPVVDKKPVEIFKKNYGGQVLSAK